MKFKKIISLFTAALVLATTIPTTDVSAAVKPKKIKLVTNSNKKKSGHTLALGEIKSIKSVGKATVNVRFSPKNSSKGFRLTSDNSSVVKVTPKNSSGTSWTMTGMGHGTAMINIRSAVKSSLKTKLPVTVVSKTPKEIKLSNSALTLLPNETKTIGAMNSQSDINVSFNSTKVDRWLNVTSSDPTIVSISKENNKNFILKALKPGTVNITVASATDTNVKENLTITVKSVETPSGFTAKQSKKDQLLVTFAQALSSTPSIKEFRLRRKGDNWDHLLKTIVISQDGKSAFLDAYIPLEVSKTYELTYTPTNAQPQTVEFTSSDNKPANLVLNTTTAVAGIPKKLRYTLTDSQGVDITEITKNRITVNVDPRDGNFNTTTGELTMYQVGRTTNVTLTYYHTEYHNTTGSQRTIVANGTITALAVSDIETRLDKVIIKDGPGKLNETSWNMASNHIVLPAGSENAHLAFRVRTSENELFTSDNKYNNVKFNFESQNLDILHIDNSTGKITLTNNATEGKQAVIIVSVTLEGKTNKTTIPINIGKESVPTRIELTPADIPPIRLNATATTLQLKIYDQYNSEITSKAYNKISIEPILTQASNQPSIIIQQPTYSGNKASFSIQATGTQTGSMLYKIVNNSAIHRPQIFVFTVTVIP